MSKSKPQTLLVRTVGDVLKETKEILDKLEALISFPELTQTFKGGEEVNEAFEIVGRFIKGINGVIETHNKED